MTTADYLIQAVIILFPVLCGVLGWFFRSISKNNAELSAMDARLDAFETRLQIVENHFTTITNQLQTLTILSTRLEERLKVMAGGIQK